MRFTRRRLALFADDRIAASMLSFCVSGTHRIKSTSPNAKFVVFEANNTRETKTKSTNATARDDDVLHERNVMMSRRRRAPKKRERTGKAEDAMGGFCACGVWRIGFLDYSFLDMTSTPLL